MALTAVFSIWAFPKIQTLNNIFHLFDEDRIVENFRSSNTLYPTRLLVKSTQPYSYSEGHRLALPTSFNSEDESFDTEKFLEDSWTTGLVIIQDDQIVSEEYYRGNTANTQNISWSMSKSFISALVGIAVDEGHIGSIDEAVEVYAPELIGSGYEGVSIKDVLQMSTGI